MHHLLEEYVNSIIEDLHWLGADPNGGIFYGSDYFDKCYEYAEKLITEGKAYVDGGKRVWISLILPSARSASMISVKKFLSAMWRSPFIRAKRQPLLIETLDRVYEEQILKGHPFSEEQARSLAHPEIVACAFHNKSNQIGALVSYQNAFYPQK